MSACNAAQEALYLTRLLKDFTGSTRTPVKMYEDNQGCIALIKNPIFQARTKHIDAKYHFIRECVASGAIDVEYCPTKEMVADGLTKPLQGDAFLKFATTVLGDCKRIMAERSNSARGSVDMKR